MQKTPETPGLERGILVRMELAIPILPGDDLGLMKQFYVSQLGFKVEWEFPFDAKSGMVGLSRGTIQLTVDCPMEGHGRQACVSLRVSDADALYNEWIATGVTAGHEPRNQNWGSRTFSVQDPAGNTIFVMGPVKG
jgi:predicted enzyme related to lactoylglutathione lyase